MIEVKELQEVLEQKAQKSGEENDKRLKKFVVEKEVTNYLKTLLTANFICESHLAIVLWSTSMNG